MGSPQEKPRQLTEKRVEVSLGSGAVVIPFHFGRHPVASDAMRVRLDELLLAGARVLHPDRWEEYHLSDEQIRAELEIEARHPEERAPLMALGLVLSQDGFVRYDRPFKSFSDPKLREPFQAIADTLVDEQYYNPAQIARRALFKPGIVYPDHEERSWDAGELVSHLTIALAERGRIFNSEFDEHGVRISAEYRWPADLAEILGIAYLLGEGQLVDVKDRVTHRMQENLDIITQLAGLSEDDRAQISSHAKALAGEKLLTPNS